MFKKIYLILSGGLDSSFCCLLTRKIGLLIKCYYIIAWYNKFCNNIRNIKYIFSILKILRLKIYFLYFKNIFYQRIYLNLIKKYKIGGSFIPDTKCNYYVKFFYFLNKKKKIVTGHYSSISNYNKSIYLKSSKDLKKNQVYFLSNLSNFDLNFVIFPVSSFFKKEVFILSKFMNFESIKRKSSKGICFIEKKNFKFFLTNKILKKKNIINLFSVGEKYLNNTYIYKKKINNIFLTYTNTTLLFIKIIYLTNFNIIGILNLNNKYNFYTKNSGKNYICYLNILNSKLISINSIFPIKKINFGQQIIIEYNNKIIGCGYLYPFF
ncbi:hypothetical protein ACT2CR_00525 [Candidatus Vidania fulgoroideorum]